MDNAQHCRSIVRKELRCLEPETTEPAVTRMWEPRVGRSGLTPPWCSLIRAISDANCCFGALGSVS